MRKNWTVIYKKHPGMWVAIDGADETTVLAADIDARKAYAQGVQMGRQAILHRVPDMVIKFA